LGLAGGFENAAAEPVPEVIRYEYTKPEMGVPFRIVLYAPDDATARKAATAAYDRIEELNGVFSDYDPDSELSRLCQTAGQHRAVRVSDDLWRVLERSRVLSEQSHGAFDVSVGPFVQLWRKARQVRVLPPEAAIVAAREKVGFQRIVLHSADHSVELQVPGMRLDFGGIAKGYAIDAALETLAQHGVRRALVAGSGDIGLGDPPPGREGWRIEVAPLDVPGAPQGRFVRLARKAVATSGDAFQRLEIDGQRYSHIVNPKTGIGLTDHSLVTVIADDCTTADSLATTVSVLGPDEGLKLIENTARVEAHLVRPTGSDHRVEVRESSGFAAFDAPSALSK
jgi:thiamine biosynthesis lipoprotein